MARQSQSTYCTPCALSFHTLLFVSSLQTMLRLRPAASKKAIKCDSLNEVRISSPWRVKTMDNSSYALRFLIIALIRSVNMVHFCGYLPLKRERLVSGVIFLFHKQ